MVRLITTPPEEALPRSSLMTIKRLPILSKRKKVTPCGFLCILRTPDRLIVGFWRVADNLFRSLDFEDLEVIKSTSADSYGQQFLTMAELPQEKLLFASEEGHVIVFDYDLNVIKSTRLHMMTEWVRFDEDKGILVFVGCGGPTLMTVKADTLEVLNKRWLSFFSITVDIDPAGNRIFQPRVFFGDIVVCDERSLKTIAKIPLEPGLRDVTYIPEKGLLIANNYFNGNLYFIDAETYKLIRTVWVGSRGRSIKYSPERDRLYLTAGLRVLEIYINKFIN